VQPATTTHILKHNDCRHSTTVDPYHRCPAPRVVVERKIETNEIKTVTHHVKVWLEDLDGNRVHLLDLILNDFGDGRILDDVDWYSDVETAIRHNIGRQLDHMKPAFDHAGWVDAWNGEDGTSPRQTLGEAGHA